MAAISAAEIPVNFIGTQQGHWQGVPEFPLVNGQTFDPDHESQWGILASRMALELPRRLQHVRGPIDMALIHLGTNDAFTGRSAENIIQSLASITATLRNYSPQVIICIAQIAAPGTGRSIPALNQALPDAARQWSSDVSPVFTVDLATNFNFNDMTYDGLHPNYYGEEWLGERWFDAIKTILSQRVIQVDNTSSAADTE